jgi:hypothetical protein
MELKNFTKYFAEYISQIGFKSKFGGFIRKSDAVIIVLSFQKSNYSPQVYLNIKLFVQCFFGKEYLISRELINKDIGSIFRRAPKEFDEIFNLGNHIHDDVRIEYLKNFIDNYLRDFVQVALTIEGIKSLAEQGELFLLPAVKNYLK